MMALSRRGFISGMASLIAAPAIVRVDSLMKLPAPVFRPMYSGMDYGAGPDLSVYMEINRMTREMLRLFHLPNELFRELPTVPTFRGVPLRVSTVLPAGGFASVPDRLPSLPVDSTG